VGRHEWPGVVTGLLARCTFPAPGLPLVCAVSGGPDSLALLVLGTAAGCRVTAVHVDHGLRDGSAAEAEVVVALIRRLRSEGITFLLVEHIMDVVMAISDRIIVLAAGRKVAEGPPAAVVSDPTVIEVYLGSEIDLA